MLISVNLIRVGMALTALAALAPLVDVLLTNTVLTHVRTAYPQWVSETVATERWWIVGWLVITNALGLFGWWLVAHGYARGRRWAPGAAVAGLMSGAVVAGANLTVGGGEYGTIVPAAFALLTVVPVVVGVAVVVSMGRERA